MIPLLEVREVHRRFSRGPTMLDRLRGKKPPVLHAVSGVSLTVMPGEVLGLVGESGCGKSTLGRLASGLMKPSDGDVLYRGESLESLRGAKQRSWRRAVQMVFQDPYASLNPRLRVDRLIIEAPVYHGLITASRRDERVTELLEAVGLPRDVAKRYPHEFSGGQRQRIGIARALAMQPELIVCDEPVAALDVSVQAQVLNLLISLRKSYSLSYLFISHDLGVMRFLCDRIAVMYLGKIVEIGSAEEVLSNPRHPYTQALVAAVPSATQRGSAPPVRGEIPSPMAPPPGCRFNPRCPFAIPRCKEVVPELEAISEREQRMVACIRSKEVFVTQ
ncbi:ABC transporter ATP-binding protein [Ramlibacter tataouinensis]|nr:ABC transporter ATP-binding protein [Ramlibacter tataouinensis]